MSITVNICAHVRIVHDIVVITNHSPHLPQIVDPKLANRSGQSLG